MSDVEKMEYTAQDIVNHALSKDAVNLATSFNDVIGRKVVDAISQRKIELAQRLMNPEGSDAANDEDALEASDDQETTVSSTEDETQQTDDAEASSDQEQQETEITGEEENEEAQQDS